MSYLRAFSVSFALIAIVSFTSCADNKKELAKSQLIKGKEFFYENRYDSALVFCNNALQSDSSLIEAEYYKGRCLENLKKHEEAILSYEKCVAMNYVPDSANHKIAINYFKLGCNQEKVSNKDSLANVFFQKSVNHSDSALRLNDKLYDAHINKVQSLHNMEKYKEALNAVNKSLLLFPDSLDLYVDRAVEKSSLNDHKTAIDEFTELEKKISDIDSYNLSKLYRFRASSNYKLNSYKKAVEDLTRALEYNSDDALIYVNRAISYYYLDRRDLCCEDLRKSADLGYINAYDLIEKFCSK